MEKKKAAILVRRSRKRRDRAENIQYQINAVQDYAKYNNYDVVEIYKDDNKSGTTMKKRDGLRKLLEDAKTGVFQYVLVWKLDRLARDLELSLEIRKALTDCDIKIISVTEWVNDDTITAKEARYSAEIQAELFIDRLRENVNRGLDGNAKRNLATGGSVPLGFDIVKKRLVINEFEAEAVRKAFAMYANGFNKHFIAQKLNEAGYRTKAGGKFTVTSFDRIFNNLKYIGTYTYDGYNGMIENPDAIPAIVDVETFERVQQRNAINRQQQNVTVPRAVYPLSGLAKCASCGHNMLVDKSCTGRDKKERITFYCKAHKVDKTCETKPVNMEYINELIIILITRQIQDSFDTVKAGIQEIQGKLNAADKKHWRDMQQEIGKLDEAVKKLGNRLGRVDDEIAGVIEAEISERKEQIRDLERELEALANKERPNITEKRLRELLSSVGAALITNGAEHEEKVVLNTIIESITISNEEIVVTLNLP